MVPRVTALQSISPMSCSVLCYRASQGVELPVFALAACWATICAQICGSDTDIWVSFSQAVFHRGEVKLKRPLRSLLKSGLWDKPLSRCFMILRLSCITLRARTLNDVLLRQKGLFAEVSFALWPAITHQHEVHKVSSGNGCSAAGTYLKSHFMNPTRADTKGRNWSFE